MAGLASTITTSLNKFLHSSQAFPRTRPMSISKASFSQESIGQQSGRQVNCVGIN